MNQSSMAPNLTVAITTEFDKYAAYPDAYAIERVWFYLIGIAGTIFGVIGLVCNLLSLIVLLHKEMRQSTATHYLLALVIYDSTFLVFNTTFVSVEYFYFGWTGRMDWYDAYVGSTIPIANAFMNVAVTGSAYTTIALSIDRCIGVKLPLRWTSVCTSSRVRIVLVSVFVWSCFLNVPLMMEHRLEWDTDVDSNDTMLVSVASGYSLTFFHSTIYLKFLNPILDAALPVVIIAVVNVLIGLAIHQRWRTSKSLRGNGRSSEQAGREAQKITIQVIIISLFTLISRALRVSTFIILEQHQTMKINTCPLYCGTIAAFSHFWNILNATINFFLYCCFGQKFRKCFMQKYDHCSCFKSKNSPSSNQRQTLCHSQTSLSRSTSVSLISVRSMSKMTSPTSMTCNT